MKRTNTGGKASDTSRTTEAVEVAGLAAKVAAVADRQVVFPGAERPGPGPARRRSPGHGRLWWACYVLFWAGTLVLLTIAALRIFYHDGTYLLTWFNAFTRYLYLPAYPVLAWALWQRRHWLAIVSLLVVGCHVVWMAPNFVRDRRFESPPSAAAAASPSPTMRVFFANVLGSNRQYDALLAEIDETDPDVVVLAEFTYGWYLHFKDSPIMARYPYSSLSARAGQLSIVSKLPIEREFSNQFSGRVVRTADIQLGTDTLRLIGLHAPRPMYGLAYDYNGFYEHLLSLLLVEEGPLLVIGDFNATEHSLVYKQLRRMRLRSAHDDRGRGYATTWPNGQLLVPPIRIDQAFLSPEVECERVVEGRGQGSDHKPVIVDVRIRERAR